MKTAFILFDDLTSLDFVGVYDPLTRLKSMGIMPNFEWRICSLAENVSDDKGLRFQADCVGEPLGNYDLLVVPGGYGTRSLQYDAAFIEWLRTAAPVLLKASVCTGALLLGAAGFLRGKPATTHPNALDERKPYCAWVVAEREPYQRVSLVVSSRFYLARTCSSEPECRSCLFSYRSRKESLDFKVRG